MNQQQTRNTGGAQAGWEQKQGETRTYRHEGDNNKRGTGETKEGSQRVGRQAKTGSETRNLTKNLPK